MKLRIAALALTSLLLTASLRSASITWVGNTSGDFSDGTNWSSSPSTPSNGDTLIFTGAAANQAVDLTSAFTATNINLNSGNYVFTGTGAPVFTLSGNISAFINADFASSLGGFSLSSGTRTMAVLTGQSLSFHTAVTGPGSLFKDGFGTLNFYGANTYAGSTTLNAGTINLDGATAVINHATSDFIIGGPSAGTPTLNIVNGADVTNLQGRIAITTNDEGHALVTGAGSTWTNTDYLYVGEAGTGTLNITTGGLVTADNVSIGNNGGGTGTVTVDGTGSWLAVTDTLYTGSQGNGTLIIQNGGDVTSVDGSIGNNSGGNGMVNVTGAGSSWVNSGNMFVGAQTTGALNITAGASVDSYNLTLGNNSGGDGGVTVDGSGTSLNVTADLRVGYVSNGTMQISSGAQVASAGGVLGEVGGATGIAKIYGSGSLWNLSGTDLYVGNGSTGRLYVYNGGQVTVGAGTGNLHLGHSPGGAGDLYIGYTGSGYAAGGVINAANIVTGASGTGTLHLGTTATVTSAYYLTKTGLTGGTDVAIGGPTAITNDAGYNVIRGTNSYTGPTDIYTGTLVAAGTNNTPLGTTGTVTVHTGGTLAAYNSFISNPLILQSGSRLIGNTGSGGGISSAVIASGVTLSPGFDSADPVNGPLGSLSFGNLSLDGGSTLEIKVKDVSGSLTNNSVTVTGSTLTINASTVTPLTLKLISLDNSYNPGALAGGVAPGVTAPLGFLAFASQTGTLILGDNLLLDTSMFDTGIGAATYTLSEAGNIYYLNFTPVPEPSTYALLALGLMGTGLAAWRKRRA